jgi:hypothetical protein
MAAASRKLEVMLLDCAETLRCAGYGRAEIAQAMIKAGQTLLRKRHRQQRETESDD